MFISISGKKQSGKSTLAEFIQLNSSHIFNDDRNNFTNVSMADPIKKMLVDVLGVDRSCVYGSDEEKRVLTKYNGKICLM